MKRAKTRPSVTAGSIKIDLFLHNGRKRGVKFHMLEQYSNISLRLHIYIEFKNTCTSLYSLGGSEASSAGRMSALFVYIGHGVVVTFIKSKLVTRFIMVNV